MWNIEIILFINCQNDNCFFLSPNSGENQFRHERARFEYHHFKFQQKISKRQKTQNFNFNFPIRVKEYEWEILQFFFLLLLFVAWTFNTFSSPKLEEVPFKSRPYKKICQKIEKKFTKKLQNRQAGSWWQILNVQIKRFNKNKTITLHNFKTKKWPKLEWRIT